MRLMNALCLAGLLPTPPAILPAQTAAPSAPAQSPAPPAHTYYLYVVSEATDQIQLVKFGPGGLTLDHALTTGALPTDVDGPHGIAVAPDGKHYFVSIGHGAPYGSLWKYTTGDDKVGRRVELGRFPATVSISPDGYLAYVANFNLYGDKVPSSVSVVATDEMAEIKRITTCTMPHGSRLSPDGTRHYSACMMDDMAVEIDTRKMAVARYFVLKKGQEKGFSGAPFPAGAATAGTATAPAATPASPAAEHGGGHDMSHGMEPPKPGDVSCSPTWAQPSADGKRLFVACNKASDIAEIDVGSWTLTRRIPAGEGVYNLAVTHDGKLLLATNKRGQSVSVFDTGSGQELKRLPTRRKVVHGVAVSSDDRYAFVSVEGVGAEPGTVEVIDLGALATVGTVDVGSMAAGVDVWKVE
jgi:DNA-binding beta-propeller fold protein YncE